MESSGEVLLFNSAYEEYKDKIEVDSMVILQGTISNRNSSDEPSVFANSLEPLETSRGKLAKAVNITLSTLGLKKTDLKPVIKICEKYPGNLTLWIKLKTSTSGNYRLKSKRYKVSADPAFIKDLRTILGQEEVWIS